MPSSINRNAFFIGWIDVAFFFLFHCIYNVACVFVFYYYYYFFDTLLEMAKYLEGASRFISFCSFKRMPLTAILEPI